MSLEGQQLGEFEILERIGQGGMGAVYKARQTRLDRTVAIKTLQASLANDADFIARFEQEARAAAGLNHPNLVQVHSAGEAEGLHWFAMEYVEGESARVRLKRKGRLDPLEAIAIAIHVATALEYAGRKAQLIHRDIKPDNIFLSSDGDVKLGDLGLAKSAGQNAGLTTTGQSMGTPHYISPEQVMSSKSVDLRADIYSLGCTLYHFLSGQAPFEGDSAVAIMIQHVNGPVPDLKKAWPECPQVLNEVVGKMMRKSPAERQQNYQELIADLRNAYEEVSQAGTVVVEVSSKAEPPSRAADSRAGSEAPPPIAVKKSKNLIPLAAAASILIGTVVGVMLFKPDANKTKGAGDQMQEPGHSSPTQDDVLPTAGWQPMITDIENLKSISGVSFPGDGWLRLDHAYLHPPGAMHDVAVRMHLRFEGRETRVFSVRERNPPGEFYTASISVDGQSLAILKQSDPKTALRELASGSLPHRLVRGQVYELAFTAKDDRLVGYIDRVPIVSARDHELAGSVATFGASGVPETLKDPEWTKLSGARGVDSGQERASGSAPAAATIGSAFTNSLGMKFVPVSITGGPTNGQRVLFSVWDTRVQDYEQFTRETKREWPKVDFEQGPTHPAVNVSWEDAQIFCQWVTLREQAAGRLPAEWRYRLPSDHEWSCAVELGAREDAAKLPSEKSEKINDAFPWGTQWPPPNGAGNYAGEELRPALAAGKYLNIKEVIAGYNDAFVNTSPVGSFAANRFGLCDMGGNVWQWCEDWFDASRKDRMRRGASWADLDRYLLLSSYRIPAPPGYRYINLGFRCVLAPADSTPSATAVPVLDKAKEAQEIAVADLKAALGK